MRQRLFGRQRRDSHRHQQRPAAEPLASRNSRGHPAPLHTFSGGCTSCIPAAVGLEQLTPGTVEAAVFLPPASLSRPPARLHPRGTVQLCIINNTVVFFQDHHTPWMPTLRILHQYPEMMKKLRTDKGAIKFVLGGANIMCPGLTHADATIHDEVGCGVFRPSLRMPHALSACSGLCKTPTQRGPSATAALRHLAAAAGRKQCNSLSLRARMDLQV